MAGSIIASCLQANVGTVNAAQPADSTLPVSTVGGTSNGSNNANVLSVNLGGASFNYDLGPDTETMADQAYNYLSNSFDSDEALLGGTIVGSQDFLSDFAAPLSSFNTQVLPSMFGTLETNNQSLGLAAVNAETTEGEASIQASEAESAQASNEGGGCFITTVVVNALGEADDGPTLTALRRFRDSYMMATAERRALVKRYYEIAPAMVKRIEARRDAREYLESLFTRFILPARNAIERGQDNWAFDLYVRMLIAVRAEV
jgi:hypothetical protein